MTATTLIVERLRRAHDRLPLDGAGRPYEQSLYSEAAQEIEVLTSLLTEVADHFDPEGLLGVDSLRGWRDIYDDLAPFRSDSGRSVLPDECVEPGDVVCPRLGNCTDCAGDGGRGDS